MPVTLNKMTMSKRTTFHGSLRYTHCEIPTKGQKVHTPGDGWDAELELEVTQNELQSADDLTSDS